MIRLSYPDLRGYRKISKGLSPAKLSNALAVKPAQSSIERELRDVRSRVESHRMHATTRTSARTDATK